MKALQAKKGLGDRPPNQLSPCKGKYLASNEPIDCIRLLMDLIKAKPE